MISEPLLGGKLETDEGETGEDHWFSLGDNCRAPWCDGVLYDGVVVFESETSEQKKIMQKAQQESVIQAAENVFRAVKSLHDTHENPVNMIHVDTTISNQHGKTKGERSEREQESEDERGRESSESERERERSETEREREKSERERSEKERSEKERTERDCERERSERERSEKERTERECERERVRSEKERTERECERERSEKERSEKERTERECERERSEKERTERECERERSERVRSERERSEKERTELECERERSERQRSEKERTERECEREKRVRSENERTERECEKERSEKERTERERSEQERSEKERSEKERTELECERERSERQRSEKERTERECEREKRVRSEKERTELECEKERSEKERTERECERERSEKERTERECERERSERERSEKERTERECERERSEREHERKRSERKRERERSEREREQVRSEREKTDRERERERSGSERVRIEDVRSESVHVFTQVRREDDGRVTSESKRMRSEDDQQVRSESEHKRLRDSPSLHSNRAGAESYPAWPGNGSNQHGFHRQLFGPSLDASWTKSHQSFHSPQPLTPLQPFTPPPPFHPTVYRPSPVHGMNNTFSSIINIQPESEPSMPTKTASSATLSSSFPKSHHQLLTDSSCGDCVLKDKEIGGLREYCHQIEGDVSYWKKMATQLQTKLDGVTYVDSGAGGADGGKLPLQSPDHYMPRRGTRIEKCDYIISDDVPQEYCRLVKEVNVNVPANWLIHVQASFRNKSKSYAIKMLINGFCEPEEMAGVTANRLIQTPVGQAIFVYGTTLLQMDSVLIKDAINSKIGTMVRALKINRVPTKK